MATKENTSVIDFAKESDVKFIPSYLKGRLERITAWANKGLENLRSYVMANGEDWDNVVTYVSKGWDYKIQERKAEVIQWLQSSNAPKYVYEDNIEKAVADLGEDNLRYWRGLAPLLRVQIDNTTGAQCLDLLKDVSVSADGWVVNQEWIDRETENSTFSMPSFMVDDLDRLHAIGEQIIQLRKDGYDVADFVIYTAKEKEALNGNLSKDYEWWNMVYNIDKDQRRPNLE